jgi:hypothetical protein
MKTYLMFESRFTYGPNTTRDQQNLLTPIRANLLASGQTIFKQLTESVEREQCLTGLIDVWHIGVECARTTPATAGAGGGAAA